jgi:heme exporter protein C
MYIHVPSAWLALLTYAIMTIYSIIGLAFKIPFSFIINKAIAPIGAVFTILCLLSGSMWGKPMWGTWWVWDARLTSVAILLVIYVIIIFLNKTFESREVREKTIAIFVLIGSINLPIIKFSVDWWNTLHQPASVSKLSSPSIDIAMLQPLLVMTIAFSLLGIIIGIMRIKAEILIRKNHL